MNTLQARSRPGRREAGFTLLELSISVALLVVISLLAFVASASSMKSVDLTRRMTTLDEELRSTMRALSDQVQPAVKKARDGFLLPAKAQELKVVNPDDPKAVTFVVPTDMTYASFSGINTIQFESEDKPDASVDGGEYGNGLLDPGEDANTDGELNRRLVLVRPDGSRAVLGGSNHLADVRFSLSPDGSMLQVSMVAAMRLEQGKTRMLQYRLNSNIFLMN